MVVYGRKVHLKSDQCEVQTAYWADTHRTHIPRLYCSRTFINARRRTPYYITLACSSQNWMTHFDEWCRWVLPNIMVAQLNILWLELALQVIIKAHRLFSFNLIFIISVMRQVIAQIDCKVLHDFQQINSCAVLLSFSISSVPHSTIC